jgi:hypothetical protein
MNDEVQEYLEQEFREFEERWFSPYKNFPSLTIFSGFPPMLENNVTQPRSNDNRRYHVNIHACTT